MSNYVPHHTKKRSRLSRLEHKLMRSIRAGEPRERHLALADEVRLGRIRVLRSERAEFEPTSRGYHERIAEIDQRIASLETMDSKKILAEYLKGQDHASA